MMCCHCSIWKAAQRKKEYMEAKAYLERLIELTPEDPIAWYNLAGVYEQLDNPQVSDYNTLGYGGSSLYEGAGI